MTSEKVTYRPIAGQNTNPELIISKTGKVEFRDNNCGRPSTDRSSEVFNEKLVAQSNAESESAASHNTIKSRSDVGLLPKRLARIELDRIMSPRGKTTSKRQALTPRQLADNAAASVSSLQSAEGFPFSVKITPKLHPVDEKITVLADQ